MDQKTLLQLDLDTLKGMYANAAARLKEALLNGAEWEAVQEYRHEVTELEIALHKRLRMDPFNPAAHQNRNRAEP